MTTLEEARRRFKARGQGGGGTPGAPPASERKEGTTGRRDGALSTLGSEVAGSSGGLAFEKMAAARAGARAKGILPGTSDRKADRRRLFSRDEEGGAVIGFGKFKGQRVADVAKIRDGVDYLRWVLKQDFPEDFLDIVRGALKEADEDLDDGDRLPF